MNGPRNPAPTVRYAYVDTPLGQVVLTGRDGLLTGLYFQRPHGEWLRDDSHFDQVRRQLDEYFAGRRTNFDVTLHVEGSPFQLAVWSVMQSIPCGGTTSYGEIAARLGRPRAARAVGAASGRNPISIIIPCHRVLGADRSLTGYGWGIDRKAWLLDHERRMAGPAPA